MDFIEIAKKRYSVRSYQDKKVEEEKLHKIVEAAHIAPTAPPHILLPLVFLISLSPFTQLF